MLSGAPKGARELWTKLRSDSDGGWLVAGGHVDLKLGCAVKEFVEATKCRVEDVTY